MDRFQSVACLELYHDFPADDDVQSIATVNLRAFILQRQWLLPFKGYVSQLKLSAQTFLMGRFQKTGAECAMDLDGCANHASGNIIFHTEKIITTK